MKLVITGPFDVERAKAIVPDLAVVCVASPSELIAEASDAEIVVGVSETMFAELIRKGDRLRWVHTSSAGVDRFLCPEYLESEVVLTCAKDGPAGPNLAEHAFGLLLALTRHIATSARRTSWARDELGNGVWELGGKTLGVIGYGGVGRNMAIRGQAFGMSVIALRRSVEGQGDQDPGITVWPPERLMDLLSLSDAVMLALPGTSDTDGLIDTRALRAMKPTAYLVNVGRGSAIETQDLVEALQTDQIAGAGLDVTEPEPLPDGHPLWSMEQVVVTPHIAGAAPERAGRNAQLVLENLKRFADGAPLVSVVDRELGY